MKWYNRGIALKYSPQKTYYFSLIFVFAAVWIWAAIRPTSPENWLLENTFLLLGVFGLILASMKFRLSNISYGFITLFFILHTIATHYNYGHVPFGFTLGEWFGSEGNVYDRMVHFSFGLLLAYPFWEFFSRAIRVQGFLAYYLSFATLFLLSGMYEIAEWAVVMHLPPERGLLFIAGTDVWDAQKDMLLATIGSIVTLCVAFVVHRSSLKERG